MKLALSAKFPFLAFVDARSRTRIETLQRENAQLREKLVAVQQLRSVAEAQSDELRSQKERLRERMRSLRRELKDLEREHSQLTGIITELRAEIESEKNT